MSRRRSIRISVLGLAVASALSGMMMVAAGSTASAVPGMDTSGSAPTPTMADEMPGMDMGGSTPTPGATMDGDMPGMDMGGSTPTPEATMDGDMPGMDMGGSTPTPEATMDGDMPGMDMGGSTPTPEPTMDGDMPGMDMGGTSGEHGHTTGGEHGDTTGTASDRPLAPVLGTFGGGASAVMLGAGLLRRKDRAASAVKEAARAARRAQR